jgi:uncharacterized membrane protein YfcA
MSLALVLALVGLGLVTGMASGLLGIGGGVLMVPALVLVASLDQQAAQATSLLVIVPTAIVGSLTLRRKGVGDLRRALGIGLVGAAGGAAGALLALALPETALKAAFAALLVFSGLKLLRDAARMGRSAEPA